MKIDFHLHTRASFDCDSEPTKIIDWAVKKGLNGLFVTEHDSTDGYKDLKAAGDKHGISVLPGVEFTVARGTHYLVYLTPELPLPQDDLSLIMEVHRRGGLVGLAHPYRSDTGLIYNQIEKHLYVQSEIDRIMAALDFIEVFNAKSSPLENKNAKDLAFRYPHLKQIAGSDSHHPATVGAAHVEIEQLKFGSIEELARKLKELPFKVVTLPELKKSTALNTVQSATEGVRRLFVKIKPAVPKVVWRIGKSIYQSGSNRLKEQSAAKSVAKKD